MKVQPFTIVLFFVLIYSGFCENIKKVRIPDGWKKPQDNLYFMDWRKKSASYYLCDNADYNGDGITDSVLILEPKKKQGLGVFLFLFNKDGAIQVEKLYDTQTDTSLKKSEDIQLFIRYYGVRNVSPGLYQTACGKGYFECFQDEPAEISFLNIGIDFFHFDAGGTRYFYWDSLLKKICFQWMDD